MIPAIPATLMLDPPRTEHRTRRPLATLTQPNGWSEQLWWDIPEAWADAVTPWADPWVVGFLFQMMQHGQPVHVAGRVSQSLLANLASGPLILTFAMAPAEMGCEC